MLCHAMLCYAMRGGAQGRARAAAAAAAARGKGMICCAMLCCAVLCCAVLCYDMLRYAVLCCAMLCCAMAAKGLCAATLRGHAAWRFRLSAATARARSLEARLGELPERRVLAEQLRAAKEEGGRRQAEAQAPHSIAQHSIA